MTTALQPRHAGERRLDTASRVAHDAQLAYGPSPRAARWLPHGQLSLARGSSRVAGLSASRHRRRSFIIKKS